ncbi:MAG TPA: protein-disulfide reductase DsbD [Candidatus Ozemobacteraceae bacterium]|nr:protein-disulfide reductase DsbD [Candidatus Ozemobacteraceae bacterium]
MRTRPCLSCLLAVLMWLVLGAIPTPLQAGPFTFEASDPATDAKTGELIGTVTARVAEGHMLYRDRLSVSVDAGTSRLELLSGHRKQDPFGPGEIEIFDTGTWAFGIRLAPVAVATEARLELGFQGCSTMTCFMPDTWAFSWPLPQATGPSAVAASSAATAPASTAEQRPSPPPAQPSAVGSVSTPGGAVDFARTIRERGLFAAMLLAFLGGLLVSLTPCVYPMIPITLSIIGSRDENRSLGRGFLLSILYVAGLSLTYALLGLAVASFGAHLRGFIQGAWFQGAMAVIFALLALSMFDLFLLQVPDTVRQRFAGFRSGGMAGVFATGMVSGLMASPCVAAPLAGILAFIASTGSALFGFMLLLAFSWGMGVLLIVLGTFSGVLNALPRAGEWMNRVKEFYGFLLLGAALYFVRPLVGAPLGDLGVALLMAAFAGFMGLFAPPTPEAPLGERVRKSIAVVGLVVACAFAVSSAARWGGLCFPVPGPERAMAAGMAMTPEGLFPRWHSNLPDALAEARKSNRPLFVDFRADWCSICRELEENVFPHRDVAPLLAKYILVRIDATRNEGEAAELLKKHAIIGLPTLLLLRPDGTEREDLRIVGDIRAADLAATLEKGLR